MKRPFRRSASAALRISLISGCGALGWLALSAGAATADTGALQGTLEPVTSVVESASTPMEPVATDVTAPLNPASEAVTPPSSSPVPVQERPADLLSNVPGPSGEVSAAGPLAPVTELVDSGLSQAPLTNPVIPITTTAITEPVLESVDSAIAPVLVPVQQAVDPVVEVTQPVVDTLAPVSEMAAPVLDTVVDAVQPVIETVTPATEVAAPILNPVVDAVRPVDTIPPSSGDTEPAVLGTTGPAVVPAPSSAEGVQLSGARVATADVSTESAPSAESAPSVAVGAVPTLSEDRSVVPETISSHESASSPTFVRALAGASHVSSAAGAHDVAPLRIAGPVTGSISASGGLSGGAGVSDTASSYDFGLPSEVFAQSGYSAALRSGPSFDPGSTPD